MFGAANGGLDREWLVDSLVIESLVVDRPALETFHALVDPSFRTTVMDQRRRGTNRTQFETVKQTSKCNE